MSGITSVEKQSKKRIKRIFFYGYKTEFPFRRDTLKRKMNVKTQYISQVMKICKMLQNLLPCL